MQVRYTRYIKLNLLELQQYPIQILMNYKTDTIVKPETVLILLSFLA